MHISLEEKIAQMCLIGIKDKNDIEPVMDLIKNRSIGGVIIYRNNYIDYESMLELVNKLHECNKNNRFPLFIAIDQEGGRVNRMPKEILNIYNASKLGSTHDEKLIQNAGKYTGKMLKETGINMDFAPVMDLKNHKDNHAIGNRAFSKDADLVAKYGISFMKGLNSKNIVSVIKHFPGHGAVTTDSHKFLPVIKNYESIKATHLYPFIKAINSGVDAIMVSHILIKDKTGFYPCSLSKTFIKKELRKNLGYKNVILTDELSMRGVRYIYGRHRSVKLAFLAGSDIICSKYYKGIEKDMIDKVVKMIKKGKIKEKDIRDSFKRIILLKEKYEFENKCNYKGVNISKINEKITELNELVDKKGN